MPAIHAIAWHNSHKMRVSFDKDPLAFLLILCDTLQEWERPKFEYSMSPSFLLSTLRSGDAIMYGLGKQPTTKLSIHCKGDFTIQFKLQFDDGILANSSVFKVWIDTTANLQRLSFGDSSPFQKGIEIHFRTPITLDSNNNPIYQLHRLREAARETHMHFLKKWFPFKVDGEFLSNKAVRWRIPDDVSKHEELILNLGELSLLNPITADMKAFYKHLTQWRRYQEDRKFTGDYAAPRENT
jgi:hypothetical protein